MTRLLFLTLLATSASALATEPPPVQTIELRSFSFAPKTISLVAGRPVTLTFVNRSGSTHDFTAKGFFSHARIVSGLTSGGQIELKGGQSLSLTLIPTAGRYPAHCSHFLHKQFGMTGEIVVR